MKLKNIMVSAVLTTALMSSSAFSSDGTINFHGQLVASTCNITVNG